MFPIRKILHPTDFSDLSKPAFELACALARDYAAELVICHVCPPAVIAVGEGMVVETSPEEAAEAAAQLVAIKPVDPRVVVSRQLLRGSAVEEITQLAGVGKIDLIVMGTHGRGGFGRLLMGSVAEGVMCKAPCPVVTVKSPLPATRPAGSAKVLVPAGP